MHIVLKQIWLYFQVSMSIELIPKNNLCYRCALNQMFYDRKIGDFMVVRCTISQCVRENINRFPIFLTQGCSL